MIASKSVTRIAIISTAIAVVLCLSAIVFADKLTEALGKAGISVEYESKLFDTGDIISIDIIMDESAWADMLDTATSEVYHQCDVVINGTTFYSVGIRPKGNTSLSSIASDPDNDRYSFKLEFDQYIDGQTCWGLDKLVLNNNYADSTNMKEAIIYDMYQYLDVDASLYNYVQISVNGEYWGVYLALEAVEDSFMLRNYGVESGNLYKPDSMNMGGQMSGAGGFNFEPGDMPEYLNPSSTSEAVSADSSSPESFAPASLPNAENSAATDMPDFGNRGDGGGGFAMGGNGANLEYTDDELSSYSTIWDGSVTDSSDADHRRVVTALESISTGTDLETYLDVDNVLKYMAVHSFSVNEDSLSGSMAHNYYLYESGGQLNILPWDYNLAFGGMSMGGMSGTSEVVNDPIDTPFSGTAFFNVLLENAEYLARYHEYYRQLVEEYVFGGAFDETYNRVHSQIDALVEADPNAMYTYEEYQSGSAMLYDTVRLRAESVLGQLDGTIPSTSEAQREDSSALIDASAIDIAVMGTFAGGGGNMFSGGQRAAQSADSEAPGVVAAGAGEVQSSAAPVADNASGAASASPERSSSTGDAPAAGESGAESAVTERGFERMFNRGGSMPGSAGGGSSGNARLENGIWYASCMALLILALLFAKFYGRGRRRKKQCAAPGKCDAG